NRRSVCLHSPPDLQRDHSCDARLGDRSKPCLGAATYWLRRIFHLQREARGRIPESAIRRDLSGLSAANEDAHPVRVVTVTPPRPATKAVSFLQNRATPRASALRRRS